MHHFFRNYHQKIFFKNSKNHRNWCTFRKILLWKSVSVDLKSGSIVIKARFQQIDHIWGAQSGLRKSSYFRSNKQLFSEGYYGRPCRILAWTLIQCSSSLINKMRLKAGNAMSLLCFKAFDIAIGEWGFYQANRIIQVTDTTSNFDKTKLFHWISYGIKGCVCLPVRLRQLVSYLVQGHWSKRSNASSLEQWRQWFRYLNA